MTRTNVIQIGLGVFLIGLFGYYAFLKIGLDSQFAGIATEASLVFLVLIWTGSYIYRVLTGQMTFMEQRKRYRQSYEKITNAELQSVFDSMPEEEKIRLLEEIERSNET